MKTICSASLKLWLTLFSVAILVACGGSSDGEPYGANDASDNTADDSQFTTSEAFFVAAVKPQVEFCRTCHIPSGIGDVEGGRLFMLSQNGSDDYAQLLAAWEALGGGVDTSKILTKASNTDAESHSGGAAWPVGSAPYVAMKTMLACWSNPAACNNLSSGDTAELPPLLGNPGKHYFVNQACDGASDDTVIDWSQDPRRLLQEDDFPGSANLLDSEEYAVHFNDAFQVCHTDTLLENQAKQNELRIAAGKEPAYTAKAYAKTCGEWRARVQEGHDWIAMWPTDSACGPEGIESCGPQGDGLTAGFSGTSSETWNNLWRLWSVDARPENYDMHISERYGHSPTPEHIYNPYPIIDPDKGIDERSQLSETFGGSGRLPLGFAQARDESGKYNGSLGLTCFSCHAGQVGTGEIAGRDGVGPSESYGANEFGSYMGLPNTNTELGVLLADLLNAAQYQIPGAENNPLPLEAVGYVPVVNATRGSNAADTEIEAIVIVRDFDTLEFSHVLTDPVHGNTGDQDPPAWWWLSNKTRYLWFGGHSTDSSRGNMYFGSVNGLSGEQVKRNEGIFESVHDWSLSLEAPSYPGAVDTALAEQGAVLFHEKNLWADGDNADIPKPKGNGACAGCHGAYSPRYINDKRFLPDPKLAGTVGYTVPIEIIDTDPAQAEGWAQVIRSHVSTFWWSYPDAQPDYLYPELKDPLTELLDDYAMTDGLTPEALADQFGRNLDRSGILTPLSTLVKTLGQQSSPITGLPLGENLGRIEGACGFEEKTVGYVTPPLHGVWASAPYFHNGSVPTVWQVLKPDARHDVWRRQSKTTPNMTVNAFETKLSGTSGGYDFEQLGWKHEKLVCDDGGQGIPYYTCQPQADALEELQWLFYSLDGGLLWPTWIVPPPVGAQGLEDRKVMSNNMYSKRNSGHEFTKVLTDQERYAIIEYLKTL